MSTDTTLFDNIPEDFLTEEDLENTEGLADALVGEDKKYKTHDEFAKSFLHKDKHIQRIERENAELRAKVTNEKTIETLLEQLTAKSSANSAPNNDQTNVDVDKKTPDLRPEDIVSRVLQELDTRTTAAKQQENLRTVQKTLGQLYGREYAAKLEEIVQDSEFPRDTLDDLAKKSPKAFFRAIGVNPDQVKSNPNSLFGTPPSPAFDSGKQNTGRPTGVRDNRFYENLRAKDPKRFNSPEVQVARMKDAEKLGDKFFNPN
jgi:hypothetical protein